MSIVWTPKHPERSRMWQFMRFVEKNTTEAFPDYPTFHRWSIENRAFFWQALCDFFAISFHQEPKNVLKNGNNMLEAIWFEGATFNFAEKLLSRRDKHPAIVSIKENGQRSVLTYDALYQQVTILALNLQRAGVVAGDRVAAIMPNVSAAVIAMLASTSIGAIWASCSPDFGVEAAVDRLGQVAPKVLFACDGHFYMGKKHDGLQKASSLAASMPSVSLVIIVPNIYPAPEIKNSNPTNNYARHPEHRDRATKALPQTVIWDDFIQDQTTDPFDFASFPFAHPIYVLFSSGTTGKPKCITHGGGGTLLQHIKELGLHTDIHEEDNLFFYTSCGWMMWNWMVSVLALGATLTLYDGAAIYPNPARLLSLLAEEKISHFGTSAKFISLMDKANVRPDKSSLAQLKTILSTGSPLLPKNYDYVYQHIKDDVQLSSISGGTDIVSCFALGNPILPVYRGELQSLGLGMDVQVYNDKGRPVLEEQGELVCASAFPSMPVCFWNDEGKKAYKKAYFERFAHVWAHGDFAKITKHRGLVIYGRSDAVLNPGGIRIGTAEIYRQIEKFPEIVDSVVIGQTWEDDVRIVLFVKLREGLQLNDGLMASIRKTLKEQASPRHVPAKILQVLDVPRTISGKVVEKAVRQVVQGEPVLNIQSLANPESLQYFRGRKELL